jgi:hypothetical protein
MPRPLLAALLAGLVLSTGLSALEVRAVLRKVDADRGILVVHGGGRDRTLKVPAGVKVLGEDGKELPAGLKSPQLRPGVAVLLTVERGGERPVLRAIRLGGKAARPAGKIEPVDRAVTAKLVPLTEMGPDARYHGFPGGLYPGGANERPAVHDRAGRELARRVQPLDAAGRPAADGKIGLLAVGFSNTVQCCNGFLDAAGAEPGSNPRVVLVNGAQGGRSAFMVRNPDDGGVGSAYWRKWVPGKLKARGLTPAQVQVIWLKQTDASLGPGQQKMLGIDRYDSPLLMGFPRGAQTLQGELRQIVQALPRLFPNVKLVYLSSRSYGGWNRRGGNPEPFAYETGFAVKWLIEEQLKGKAELNYDPGKGKVRAPWLSWGPHLWANGERKRRDGHSSPADDFAADRMHHAAQGQRKMGQLLLRFFKTDATTRGWFLSGR